MPDASGLLTDLYELTMAAGYFSAGLNTQATFGLFAVALARRRTPGYRCGARPAPRPEPTLSITAPAQAYSMANRSSLPPPRNASVLCSRQLAMA